MVHFYVGDVDIDSVLGVLAHGCVLTARGSVSLELVLGFGDSKSRLLLQIFRLKYNFLRVSCFEFKLDQKHSFLACRVHHVEPFRLNRFRIIGKDPL